MWAQDFPGWLAAIAGLSAEQRGGSRASASEGGKRARRRAGVSIWRRLHHREATRQADGGRAWNDER